MAEYPPVLDVCCSARGFWFDKKDPRALYTDIRLDKKVVDVGTDGTKGRNPVVIAPDMIADFRDLPFPDDTFFHVVFDPPHCHVSKGASDKGTVLFRYGKLSGTWRKDLARGFSECLRVLRPGGTLIFKWCEMEIQLKEILKLCPADPLYGHRTGKKAQTHWVAFIK